MPQNENGGAGRNPDAPAEKSPATKQPLQGNDSAAEQFVVVLETGVAPRRDRLPVANAIAVPPVGRRRLWLWLVRSCPYCALTHVHRAGGIDGAARTGGCGRDYFVRVVRSEGRAAA